MKVSIITVSFNASKTIRDTIESVISQKGVDIEYILVDGNSTDGTQDIIRSYGEKISKFISEPDNGIYDGMNKGVSLASGDIIGILNADDVYAYDEVLKDIISVFKSDVEGVYADLVYVAEDDLSKVKRTWVSKSYVHGSFRKGWMPPHPTFFVKREVYEKYGSYTLQLRSAADYEFMLRVIHKNEIKVGYLNKVIVRMRVGGTSNASLKNRVKANKEDKIAWKMNGLKPAPFTMIRKPLSKIGQFFKR
ncbi:MAG: glycosyltransferase family 2 protein [Crocinitomicaceae bacterium]|nr:glycosyltransferase [Crocinitomicaceae bacterium]